LSEIDEELNKLTHAVIGAAIAVHRTLGPGFLEKMYEEALCIEMEARGIPYARQVDVTAMYRGREIGTGTLDLLVEDRLIVELKAVEALVPVHEAQALAYLRMTGKRLALLINFNVPVLREGVRRIAL
jgi:GxxExxY protein